MTTPDTRTLAERAMEQNASTQKPEASSTQPMPTTEVTQSKRTFERRTFTQEIGTGKEVDKKGRETEGKGEEITISKEAEAKYTNFLKDYLTRFSEAVKNNPSLRNNKVAQVDIMLMDGLTTNGKPDPDKISRFLDKEEGWIVTTEAITRYYSSVNSALGFLSETIPPGKRAEALEAMKVRLGNKGIFSIFGRSGSSENKMGVIDLTQNTELFEAIKGDPEENAYLKALTGIDLNHLESFAGSVRVIPNMIAETNRNPEDLRKEVIKGMYARRDFFKDIGVPLNRLDSLPEESLLNNSIITGSKGFEQTSTTWGQKIIDGFKPNRGGVRDGNGNTPEIQTPAGRWITNPNYNPGINGIDTQGNVLRFYEARRKVMLLYVSEIAIKDALKKPDKIASVVTERLRTIDIDGEGGEKARRIKEATAKKTELAAEREEMDRQLASLETVEESNLVTNIPKNLVEAKKAYDDFINIAGSTIRPEELEHLTIDRLISLATNPPYNLPNNTPEAKTALRLMLLRAKAEHKAMQIEEYDQSPVLQRDTFKMIVEPPGATPTINPDNLLTMPQQQLRHLLSQPPYNWNGSQIENSLPLAQQEARRKLITRHGVYLEEKIKDLNQQIQSQDKIIESAGNLEKVKEALVMTDIILTRQGEIINEAIAIPRETQKYTDLTLVRNTDTEYSQAEREKALPKAYYEMLNVLFDYQHGGKIGDQALSREEYFKRIHNFLPPDKLLSLTAESMELAPLATSPPFTFGYVFSPDNFTSNTEILKSFEKMIIKLGKEAIAL